MEIAKPYFRIKPLREVGSMALTRWVPSKEIEALRKDIERMYEELMGEPLFARMWRRFPLLKRLSEVEGVYPPVDMYDRGEEIVVKAEIPGVDKDNISISLRDNALTIRGEVKKEEEVNEEDYYYAERSYGSFSRTLTLPTKVNASKVKASFKNGVLEIRLPKAEEAKSKEIKIEVK